MKGWGGGGGGKFLKILINERVGGGGWEISENFNKWGGGLGIF